MMKGTSIAITLMVATTLTACGDEEGGGGGCGEACGEKPSECDGTVQVSFSAPTQGDGCECEYQEARTDCLESGLECVEGRCGCGLSCPPLQPFCLGDERVTPGTGRVTVECSCDYNTGEVRYDCRTQAMACLPDSGECGVPDPCARVECPTPGAGCSTTGDLLTTYSGEGACEVVNGAGVCNFDAVAATTNCAELGQVCRAPEGAVAACEPP